MNIKSRAMLENKKTRSTNYIYLEQKATYADVTIVLYSKIVHMLFKFLNHTYMNLIQDNQITRITSRFLDSYCYSLSI